MKFNQSFFVNSSVIPARIINIAIDTARLYSQNTGTFSGAGVYMMDNNVLGGSGPQGGIELKTELIAGFGVCFNAFPIDSTGSLGDIVQIMGFEFSDGTNVFGNFGYPVKQPETSPYQWLGTAMTQGSCTYQIKVGVSINGAPMKYYWWSAYLVCSA